MTTDQVTAAEAGGVATERAGACDGDNRIEVPSDDGSCEMLAVRACSAATSAKAWRGDRDRVDRSANQYRGSRAAPAPVTTQRPCGELAETLRIQPQPRCVALTPSEPQVASRGVRCTSPIVELSAPPRIVQQPIAAETASYGALSI